MDFQPVIGSVTIIRAVSQKEKEESASIFPSLSSQIRLGSDKLFGQNKRFHFA